MVVLTPIIGVQIFVCTADSFVDHVVVVPTPIVGVPAFVCTTDSFVDHVRPDMLGQAICIA